MVQVVVKHLCTGFHPTVEGGGGMDGEKKEKCGAMGDEGHA